VQFGVAGLIAHVLQVTLWGLLVVERVGLVVSRSVCLCSQSGAGAGIVFVLSAVQVAVLCLCSQSG
jgi:hypothetical protein